MSITSEALRDPAAEVVADNCEGPGPPSVVGHLRQSTILQPPTTEGPKACTPAVSQTARLEGEVRSARWSPLGALSQVARTVPRLSWKSRVQPVGERLDATLKFIQKSQASNSLSCSKRGLIGVNEAATCVPEPAAAPTDADGR